jgi:tRNA-Thr(GGU) m(6)t(6)A37 methyltransferase TsaA
MTGLRPVGWVRASRSDAIDDDWDSVTSAVEFDAAQFSPEALLGIEEFSHVEIIFTFDQVDESEIEGGARHPRGNTAWPRVGIFAQRAKGRPNRLGSTTCALVAVEGLTLRVAGLDALDGTPVLDVKPYMTEFGPRGPVRQPEWSHELMRGYWGPAPTSGK